MRRALSLLAILAALSAAPAFGQVEVSRDPARVPSGAWTADRAQSSVTARVTHLGLSWYVMRFNAFDATLTGNPAQLASIRLSASVEATSLDVGTEYSRRFAEQFLDATRAPRMTFVSTSVQMTGQATATVTGNLTIRGVTKPATFAVTFNGVGKGLMGDTRAGFSAVATIKRSEWGSEFLLNVVGDEVTITIETQFVRR